MHSSTQFLITIGGILLLAIAADVLGKHTFLPRVTLLLVFGIIIGNFAFIFDLYGVRLSLSQLAAQPAQCGSDIDKGRQSR